MNNLRLLILFIQIVIVKLISTSMFLAENIFTTKKINIYDLFFVYSTEDVDPSIGRFRNLVQTTIILKRVCSNLSAVVYYFYFIFIFIIVFIIIIIIIDFLSLVIVVK